jgi:hypothetical protein
MPSVKERLRPLDRIVAPELWSRVISMEASPESDVVVSEGRGSRRLVAVVVSFLVFFTAGAFAWEAFRTVPSTPSTSAGDSVDGTILWPEQTAVDLASTQRLVDSGDSGVSWRLDPKEVATRFAEHVLGWGAPEGRYVVTIDGSGDPRSNAPSGVVTASISRVAIPCPSPLPGEPTTCPPPFAGETLWIRQPATTGASGVWSVEAAFASGLTLDLGPGDLLQNGDSIQGAASFPATASNTPGYAEQRGFFVGTGPDCSSGSVEGGAAGSFAIEVSVGKEGWSNSHCSAESIGFAWIAAGNIPKCPDGVSCSYVQLLTSPVLRSTTEAPLYGLTAVPVLISVLNDRPSATTEATASMSGAP